MSFNNKVALVTGGSSGIGAAIAILFAKEGADVAFVGRNETKLKKIADEIVKVGKEPLVIKADVSKDEETRKIIENTINRYGKLDILINNAGIIRFANVKDENLIQVYDEIMNTNLRSTILLTNLAAPHLIKTKGNIVNVSSVAATVIADQQASYCISKAGMDHFSRVAALELAEKGVRVNVVSPGPVETDIIENAGLDVNWNAIAEKTALKIITQPEEVANLVLYLASDKARSITGSTFTIDAGYKLLN